jgi:hypothetical protein
MIQFTKEVEEDKLMKAGIKYLRELGKIRRAGPLIQSRKTLLTSN